ncbi:phospholipid scramblase 2-like [Convolutriloba macropyga]|uniref:phospholipid scramblase 2-like n=1 Tax=Convolutriloba macropyga TaxID=536237 RepID=UPI003F521687
MANEHNDKRKGGGKKKQQKHASGRKPQNKRNRGKGATDKKPALRSKRRAKNKSKGKKKVHCPGLEYLKYIDTLILMQTPDLIEVLTGWSTANHYVIRNGNLQQVYMAFERTNEIDMYFRAQYRNFIMHIVDNHMQEVLRILRENPGGCGGSNMHVDVESPPGQFIGSVEMGDTCCTSPEYILMDHRGKPKLLLKGESASMCWAELGYAFDLITVDGKKIGQIYKEFSNIVQEQYTNADNYILKFPRDLSVQMKALLIGAALQIDYVHFENDPNYDPYHQHHHHHHDHYYW